jgi:hypothetical protein
MTPPSISECDSYCSLCLRLTYYEFVQLIDNLTNQMQVNTVTLADIILYW